MTMKTYYRPTGLVFGADVERLVRDGDALPLAGMGHVAFTHVDVITRVNGVIERDMQRMSGVDDTRYSGFAWGMGIDRVAILKYGIEDIRLFFENDLRFLNQF